MYANKFSNIDGMKNIWKAPLTKAAIRKLKKNLNSLYLFKKQLKL